MGDGITVLLCERALTAFDANQPKSMVSITPSFDGFAIALGILLTHAIYLGARDLVRSHGETNARNIVVVGSAQLLYQVDGR